MMALKIACCACSMANLNRVGGWMYVVPRKSLMSDQVTESAGVSAPKQGEETTELDIAENDLKKCNVCSEPFVIRRAQRQEHGRNCSTNECG